LDVLNLLKSKYAMLTWIAGIIVVLDQATKALITGGMPLYQSIPVIRGVFNITHIHNPGGAFGFLAGQNPTIRSIVFIIASFFALGLILYFFKNTPRTHRFLSVGFALIFGGAIGNLIDRIRMGSVVDFLDFFIGEYHWPAFNVADSAISVGIAIFLYHLLLGKMPE